METLITYGSADEQGELIRRFCDKAEESLEQAPDYASARQLVNDLCESFARECSSPMVVHATRAYMEQVIEKLWDGKGNVDDYANDQH